MTFTKTIVVMFSNLKIIKSKIFKLSLLDQSISINKVKGTEYNKIEIFLYKIILFEKQL